MNDICIFLQARMSSSRLLGKSLMNISGYPLVVLSALRAGNTGIKVVVLTSTDSSDDILYKTVLSYGINCIRGDLKNVLSRFGLASNKLNLDKNSLIVRLTADNVVPDGKLIEDVISHYIKDSGVDYIGSNYPNDKLPYGLNVEVFQVSSLDDACTNATRDYDKEHVTPWIKENYKCQGLPRSLRKDKEDYISEKLNLTIDSNEELMFIRSVFYNTKDPINESWYKICKIAKNKIK